MASRLSGCRRENRDAESRSMGDFKSGAAQEKLASVFDELVCSNAGAGRIDESITHFRQQSG